MDEHLGNGFYLGKLAQPCVKRAGDLWEGSACSLPEQSREMRSGRKRAESGKEGSSKTVFQFLCFGSFQFFLFP